jgi:WD40 repeat protein
MSSSVDRTLLLWDLDDCEPLEKFDMHPGTVWCLHVDWLGRRMVSGAGPGDNTVRLWDFSDGHCEMEIFGHQGSVWGVDADWATAHRAVAEAEGIGIDPETDGLGARF